MDGWTDGWMDGWMDGWLGGWVGGWMDGLVDAVQGLKGAIIYYDGQMNDARLSLVVALTATQQGACIANRVKVTG